MVLKGVGVHALNDWKNAFEGIIDIRIEISLLIHIYTNSDLG